MLANKQFLILAGSILWGSEFLEQCFEKYVGIRRHRDDNVKM